MMHRPDAAAAEDTSPSVALLNGYLHIVNWQTDVPDVVRHFEDCVHAEGEGLATELERVLKVGALAISTADTTLRVDYVQKEFDRLHRTMEQLLDQRVQTISGALENAFAEDSGAMSRALKEYLGEGGHLADLFDPNRVDSAVGRFRELLQTHFDGKGSKIYQLLDSSSTESPLHNWREEFKVSLESLRRTMEDYRSEVTAQIAAGKARAESLEKSGLKGRAYQDLVFDTLERIARVFGDTAESTGDTPGVGGSKAGDAVVTVNSRDTSGVAVRMVFEQKDRPLGLTPILRELDDCKRNRAATAAVAVYSRADYMPAGAAPFREHGNARSLCLFDKDDCNPLPLELAYRAARCWALSDLRPDEAEVDTRGIREDVEDARTQLRAFTSLKGKLTRLQTSLGTGIQDIEQDLDDLQHRLVGLLNSLDQRVQAASPRPSRG